MAGKELACRGRRCCRSRFSTGFIYFLFFYFRVRGYKFESNQGSGPYEHRGMKGQSYQYPYFQLSNPTQASRPYSIRTCSPLQLFCVLFSIYFYFCHEFHFVFVDVNKRKDQTESNS